MLASVGLNAWSAVVSAKLSCLAVLAYARGRPYMPPGPRPHQACSHASQVFAKRLKEYLFLEGICRVFHIRPTLVPCGSQTSLAPSLPRVLGVPGSGIL